MIAADFDRVAADILAPRLAPHGWQVQARATWLRSDSDGQARLALNPSRQCERFSVMVGWDPSDMVELMHWLLGDEYDPTSVGFLCGPYLTPAGVFRRPKHWHSRTKADMVRSLEDVYRHVATVAEPWLARLKDPLVLAEAADPVASLLAGYAWERAARLDRARPLYEEMWRRLLAAFEIKSRTPVPGSMKRQYVFVAGRLGHATSLAEQLRSELGSKGGPTTRWT